MWIVSGEHKTLCHAKIRLYFTYSVFGDGATLAIGMNVVLEVVSDASQSVTILSPAEGKRPIGGKLLLSEAFCNCAVTEVAKVRTASVSEMFVEKNIFVAVENGKYYVKYLRKIIEMQ